MARMSRLDWLGVGALGTEIVAVWWWIWSAFHATGGDISPLSRPCFRDLLAHADPAGSGVRGEWTWFPPGTRCVAVTRDGQVFTTEPTWSAVLTPTIVLAVLGLAVLAVLVEYVARHGAGPARAGRPPAPH